MPKRDPRIDPRPEDVLSKGNYTRCVGTRNGGMLTFSSSFYADPDGADVRYRTGCECHVSQWRNDVANWEVVYASA